jgi:hypothetical protein
LSRGALYQLLRNRIYVGEVVHKHTAYPGQHDALIDQESFAAATALLDEGRIEHVLGRRSPDPSLLAGLLWDRLGRRMSPSHALKRGCRYRYYVSQPGGTDAKDEQRWRTSAADIERRVIATLIEQLCAAEQQAICSGSIDAECLQQARADISAIRERLRSGTPREQRQILLDCVERIDLSHEAMAISLRLDAVNPLFGTTRVTAEVPIGRVRSGKQLRLIISNGEPAETSRKNPALIKLVAQAMSARDALAADDVEDFEKLAAQIGYSREHAADLLRIGFLAPEVVAAILDGRQPEGLTRTRLVRWPNLPLEWAEQRVALGF